MKDFEEDARRIRPAQNENLNLGQALLDLTGCGQPVQERHFVIHNHDLGAVSERFAKGLLPIRGRGADLPFGGVRGKHAGQPMLDEWDRQRSEFGSASFQEEMFARFMALGPPL